MDDDLMPLRSNDTPGDDDLFSLFSDGEALPSDDPFASLDATEVEQDPFADETLPSMPTSRLEPPSTAQPAPILSSDEPPEWLRAALGGLEGEEEEPVSPPPVKASPSARQPRRRSSLAGSGPQGRAFGMTAQQRMVLSIFLFLDVTVLAVALLIAIGAISLPIP